MLYVGKFGYIVIANWIVSAEAFYAKSLQAYIDRFDFTEDPLDVAVRRLLMNV